jgi:hypothetical protein
MVDNFVMYLECIWGPLYIIIESFCSFKSFIIVYQF